VANFRKLEEVAVDENAIGTIELLGECQYCNSIADAKRMIGYNHQRYVWRHSDGPKIRIGVAGVDVEPSSDHVKQFVHHPRTLVGNLLSPGVIEFHEVAAA